VYFLDTVDYDLRNGYDDTPVTRERLLKTCDLTPVADFDAARYGAGDLFGKPKATLWKVEPWVSREVLTEVEQPLAGEALLLRLNARALADGTPVEIVVGGQTVSTRLHPGFDWVALDARPSPGRRLPLRVRAGVPLPRDMAPRLYGPDDQLRLDIGSDAAWFDSGFFDRGLAPPPREGGWIVGVPVLTLPESDLVLSAEVSCTPGTVGAACSLHLSGAGTDAAISVPPGEAWRTVSLRLGEPEGGGVTADIRVSPDSPRLRVRRFIVSRLRHAGPPLVIAMGAGDEPHIVRGLYVAEQRRDGISARWTDGDAFLQLPAGAAASVRQYALTLRTLGPPPQVADREVRLEMNGRAIGDFTSLPRAQESVIAVPAGLLHAGLNELRIRSAPWNAARISVTTDTRTLGLMLEAVRLEPR
jgi:hypothetical protein